MADDWGNDPLVTAKPADESWGNEPLVMPKTIADRVAPSVGERVLHGIGNAGVGLIQLAAHGERVLLPGPAMNIVSKWVDEHAKAREDQYQESRGPNPGTDWWGGAGEIVGSLPAAALTGGDGLVGGALSGVAAAATQPVTEGNFLRNKLEQVGIGGALGAAGGVIGNKVGGFINYLTKSAPERAASAEAIVKNDAVKELLGRIEQGTSAGGPTAEQAIDLVRKANAAGTPMTLMEAGGAPVRDLAGAIYRKGGVAKNELASFLKGREAASGDRLTSAVEDSLGGGVSTKQAIEALASARSAAARPLYSEVDKLQNIWSPRLQEFLDDPEVKKGLARGYKLERLDALAEGRKFDPTALGVDLDAEGNVAIRRVPNMRVLDMGKRGLDAMIGDEKDPVTGRMTALGRSLEGVRKQFVSELDDLDPTGTYAKAREAWGGLSRSMDATKEGGKFLSKDPRDITDEIAKLSPNDREFFKLGAANAIIKNQRQRLRHLDALRQDFLVDQLRPLFDSDANFQHFVTKARHEGEMLTTHDKVMGNSMTAERAQEDIAKRAVPAGHAVIQAMHGNYLGAALNAIKAASRDRSATSDVAKNIAMSRLLTAHNPIFPAPPQPQPGNALLRMLPAAAAPASSATQNGVQ